MQKEGKRVPTIFDGDKIKRMMSVFRISQKSMAEVTGIERSVISRMISGEIACRDYQELLNGYLDAQIAAKRAEHECMIALFERFK